MPNPSLLTSWICTWLIGRLRLEVTGFDQETFATMCNMSIKTLYLIENDKGNPTISTLIGAALQPQFV